MKWQVVATVSEPAPLILANVAHYLAAGAAHVTLYFDNPDPDLMAVLNTRPDCTAIERGAAFWRARGHDPSPFIPKRQRFNLQEAYDASDADWILHADADEFLVDVPRVLAVLEAAPHEVEVVEVFVSERAFLKGAPVRSIFDGVFRRNTTPDGVAALRAVYGADVRYLNLGLVGYSGMKSFVRGRRGIAMDVHQPAKRRDGTRPRAIIYPDPVLLHFDGMTRAHYLAKHLRNMREEGWRTSRSPSRRAQLLDLAEMLDDPAAMDAFHDRLKVLTEEQARALEAMGLLDRRGFDPSPALAQVFPGLDMDLSPEAYDRLRLEHHTGQV